MKKQKKEEKKQTAKYIGKCIRVQFVCLGKVQKAKAILLYVDSLNSRTTIVESVVYKILFHRNVSLRKRNFIAKSNCSVATLTDEVRGKYLNRNQLYNNEYNVHIFVARIQTTHHENIWSIMIFIKHIHFHIFGTRACTHPNTVSMKDKSARQTANEAKRLHILKTLQQTYIYIIIKQRID